MTVTAGANAPLWEQVLHDLRARLARGEFDARFPTDRELVERYGVSRHTAREAVRRLRDGGLIVRERGRGSFLRSEGFEQPLGSLYSLFRSVEAGGIEQRSEVLALDVVTDPVAADRLGLGVGGKLVHLVRARYAGGEPLALDRVWLPAKPARALLKVDFTHTALYDELARRCGVVIDGARERILPIVPDDAVATLLELAPGTGAFFIERLGTTAGVPVEYRTTIVRGDRFSFVAEWSANGATVPLVLDRHDESAPPAGFKHDTSRG